MTATGALFLPDRSPVHTTGEVSPPGSVSIAPLQRAQALHRSLSICASSFRALLRLVMLRRVYLNVLKSISRLKSAVLEALALS